MGGAGKAMYPVGALTCLRVGISRNGIAFTDAEPMDTSSEPQSLFLLGNDDDEAMPFALPKPKGSAKTASTLKEECSPVEEVAEITSTSKEDSTIGYKCDNVSDEAVPGN